MIRKTTLSVSALALLIGLGGLPAVAQQATTTDEPRTEIPPAAATEAPAAEAETTTEDAPAATIEEAPAAEAEATTEDAPAATTEEAPAAEAEATTEEAPAAEAEATTEEAPAAEAEATTEEAPAAEAEATTEEEPAADAEATTGQETGDSVVTAGEEPSAEAEDGPDAIDAAGEEVGPAAEENTVETEAVAPEAGEAAEAEHTEIEGDTAEEEHAAGGHGETHTTDVDFSFEGPFGAYDQFQLQRGLQIYTEVCSACHGLRYVPIRTIGDEGGPGMPEDQVRAYAANFEVYDDELEDFRPATPGDHFPGSALENAPDLSLMAKARAGFHGPYGLGINQFVNGIGGPEHIYSILTGYTGRTREQAGTTFYENTAFDGGWIAMAPPLAGEDVEFADGHANDLSHEAEDVAAFLMWAAEPKMMARKQAGFTGVIFLGILAVLLYLTNKRIWYPHKHRTKRD
ncbi:hypothetical protein GCM10011534_34250 [Pseudooceanicola nanhaiensis]|uniref:Cytochrome c1 n=1 Tax=Pseudooceanicola nanhaiensis TaxID=375761 RepID=A0A917T4Q9_9RHOB|nr:cytochrome c1 [Pseudooceanicola nanhaiensis]GGM09390.1 hypothetical protein GCM10011534_34250 [Pseudooceanicola nanhaiensis]